MWVLISTSTKTGIAPYCIIGFTVVGKPAATVITSSPFFIALSLSFGDVSAVKASKFAEDPEFVVNKYLIPKKFDNDNIFD